MSLSQLELSLGPKNRGAKSCLGPHAFAQPRRDGGVHMPAVVQTLDEAVGFPIPLPAEHTMTYSLVNYCRRRLPAVQLEHLQQLGIQMELHGIYSGILEGWHEALGYSWVERLVWRGHSMHKKFNHHRPTLFLAWERATGDIKAILAVVPGEDYVRHYASMLSVFLRASSSLAGGLESGMSSYSGQAVARYKYASPDAAAAVRVVTYPAFLSPNIPLWTGLQGISMDVQRGDIVVLGFVNELEAACKRLVPATEVLLDEHTPLYHLVRLRFRPKGSKKPVVFAFLGVVYSFWGNLGGVIVGELWKRRPQAICYVAKHGTLTSPWDIHSRMFSPSRFCVFDKGDLRWISDKQGSRKGSDSLMRQSLAVPNPLANMFPQFDTGLHASVPTVVEETLDFRSSLTKLGVSSIDNEVSQMARTIKLQEQQLERHNGAKSVPCTNFVPLLFATDYLRKREEVDLHVPFDLTSRCQTVEVNKDRFLKRAAALLLETFSVVQSPRAVIIGTGYGVRTILPALRGQGVNVVGLAGGRDGKKTDRLARENGIPAVYNTLDAITGLSNPSHNPCIPINENNPHPTPTTGNDNPSSLLFIASPHDAHESQVQHALNQGNLDIICEKPLALSRRAVRHLARQSRQNPAAQQRLNLINHPLRFYPPFIYMKDLFFRELEARHAPPAAAAAKIRKGTSTLPAAGGVGGPGNYNHNYNRAININIRYTTARLRTHSTWNWVFERARGGGMVLAVGTHFLDLFEWIIGAPLTTTTPRAGMKDNSSSRSPSLRVALTTRNDIPALPASEGSEEVRVPEVESGFDLRGEYVYGGDKEGGDGGGYGDGDGNNINGKKVARFKIDCDGAAGEDLLEVVLGGDINGDSDGYRPPQLKFVCRKGDRVRLYRAKSIGVPGPAGHHDHKTTTWEEIPIKMEDRILNQSPWKVAFDCLADRVVHAVRAGERESLSQEATTFSDFERQMELLGSVWDRVDWVAEGDNNIEAEDCSDVGRVRARL